MNNPAQEILLNKYRIEALIGQGGFGKVYLVTHLQLNVQRALKVLRRDAPGVGSYEFDSVRSRFQLEAQLGAQLNAQRPHPNLLQVYDFHNGNDLLALEMEYAPGGSLAERLNTVRAANQVLSINESIQNTLDITQGLAAIHRLDVVHRDLKPTNILLAYNRAKVADLGIAQAPGGLSMRSTSSDGRRMPHPGTPGYMSPEQEHTTGYLKPPSDIYALGLITFEMLTGHIYSSLRPGTQAIQLRPDTPAWLNDLLACMLAYDPGNRPWDGGELASILLVNIRHPGQAATPPPPRPDRQTIQMTPPAANQAGAGQPGENRVGSIPSLTATAVQARSGSGYTPTQRDAQPSTLRRTIRSPYVLVSSGLAAFGILILTILLLMLGLAARPGQPPAAALITLSPGLPPAALTASPAARSEATSQDPGQPKQVVVVPPTTSPVPPQPLPSATATATATRDPSLPPASTEPGALWTAPQDGASMIYIPAGEFTMGATDLQTGPLPPERPPHQVTLDAYWIAQTEVTNAQYERCVQAGKCRPPLTVESFTRQEYYGNSAYDQYPVIFVSWDDANAYCTWAGGRLPTDAEWEKAARGEDQRSYPWGEKLDCNRANYWEYEREDRPSGSYTIKQLGCQKDTAAVGSYPTGASPYGVLDMVGNVGEWVSDWYAEYSFAAQVNPTGPLDGKNRVIRGFFGYFEYKGESGGGPERSVSVGGGYGGGSGTHYFSPPAAPRVNSNKTVSGRGNLISGYTFYFIPRSTFRSYADPATADYNIGFRCAMPAAR